MVTVPPLAAVAGAVLMITGLTETTELLLMSGVPLSVSDPHPVSKKNVKKRPLTFELYSNILWPC